MKVYIYFSYVSKHMPAKLPLYGLFCILHYLYYKLYFIFTLLILLIESLHWLFKYSVLRCLYLLLNLKNNFG